jgi:hypothetical protein
MSSHARLAVNSTAESGAVMECAEATLAGMLQDLADPSKRWVPGLILHREEVGSKVQVFKGLQVMIRIRFPHTT